MNRLPRDLRTQYRLLAQNMPVRRLMLGYGFDRVAIWVLSVALSVKVYQETGSITSVAWLLLVYILARFGLAWYSSSTANMRQPRVVATATFARIVAAGSLFFADGTAAFWWAILAFAVIAGATGILEHTFQHASPRYSEVGEIATLNGIVRSIEQLSAFIGPLAAGIVLLSFNDRLAAVFAAALLLTSALLGRRLLGGSGAMELRVNVPFTFPRSFLGQVRPYDKIRMVIIGLLYVAATGVLLRVALVDVVINRLDFSAAYYGIMIALIGIGALVGPVPVDKLLGHLSVEFVFMGGVLSLAVGAIVAGLTGHAVLVAPVLLASGVVIVTLDVVASVALRRLVAADDLAIVDWVMLRAVLAGQIVSLGVVLVIASVWNVSAAIVVVSAAAGLTMVGLFLASGASLTAWQMITASNQTRNAGRDARG